MKHRDLCESYQVYPLESLSYKLNEVLLLTNSFILTVPVNSQVYLTEMGLGIFQNTVHPIRKYYKEKTTWLYFVCPVWRWGCSKRGQNPKSELQSKN